MRFVNTGGALINTDNVKVIQLGDLQGFKLREERIVIYLKRNDIAYFSNFDNKQQAKQAYDDLVKWLAEDNPENKVFNLGRFKNEQV